MANELILAMADLFWIDHGDLMAGNEVIEVDAATVAWLRGVVGL